MFRGREMSHPEIGHEVLQKALTGLGETASVEKQPGMEGRFLTVILTPNAKKPTGEGNRLKARLGPQSPPTRPNRQGQSGGRRARAGSAAAPETVAETEATPEPEKAEETVGQG